MDISASLSDTKVVKRGVDFKWLKTQAKNKATLDRLHEIERWREDLLKRNYRSGDSMFCLDLSSLHVFFRESDAAHSIKVYTEIFKEDLHFLHKDFRSTDNKVVVDLGANVGFYAMRVKELMPDAQVLSVEPNPRAYEVLEKNIESNSLSNVHIVKVAACSSSEPIHFRSMPQASALAGRYFGDLKKSNLEWVRKDAIEEISVPCKTLGSILTEYGVIIVDILKFDVQDMELEIIESSPDVLSRVRKIMLEPHSSETMGKIMTLLDRKGFELVYREPRDFGDLYFLNRSI